MSIVIEKFPNLARGLGLWTGTYTFIDAETGAVVKEQRVDCLSEFPDDGSADFRLTVHNFLPDGTTRTVCHVADLRGDRLEWRDTLVGWMQELDEATVYLTFGFPHDPDVRVREMIQISPDGQDRARVWHWFRNEKLYQITIAREQRCGLQA